MRWLLLVLAVAFPNVLFAGFQEGLDAYHRGDYVTALKDMRALFEQGDADAQYHLGRMYRSGRGVPTDFLQAYAWYNVAAAQGLKLAADNRAAVQQLMTPAQVAEGQALSRELYERLKDTPEWGALVPITSTPKASASPSRELVRNVQTALRARGYNPGPIDGVMGQRTAVAVKAFQRSMGLEPTGVISQELVLLPRQP